MGLADLASASLLLSTSIRITYVVKFLDTYLRTMLPYRVFPRQCALHSPFGTFPLALPALNSLLASINENVSPLFSWSRALFTQMSRPEFRATCLESIHCALFEKQRRGTPFRLLSPFPKPRLCGLGAPVSSALKSLRVSLLECAVTQNADASPLDSAVTKNSRGGVHAFALRIAKAIRLPSASKGQ